MTDRGHNAYSSVKPKGLLKQPAQSSHIVHSKTPPTGDALAIALHNRRVKAQNSMEAKADALANQPNQP